MVETERGLITDSGTVDLIPDGSDRTERYLQTLVIDTALTPFDLRGVTMYSDHERFTVRNALGLVYESTGHWSERTRDIDWMPSYFGTEAVYDFSWVKFNEDGHIADWLISLDFDHPSFEFGSWSNTLFNDGGIWMTIDGVYGELYSTFSNEGGPGWARSGTAIWDATVAMTTRVVADAPTHAPVPASIWLMLAGAGSLALVGRRARRAA